MINRIVLIALALCCALIVACGGAAPRDPFTLNAHLGAEPDTLNPVLSSDAYSSTINGYIYETLLDMDRDTLERKPDLAERWEISADRKRYRFYLKKGVLWSDGVEFTADDVVYSFKVIKDPKTANAHRKVNYIDIREVRKVDRYTVDFIYSKQYYLGLEICGGMMIIPDTSSTPASISTPTPTTAFPWGRAPTASCAGSREAASCWSATSATVTASPTSPESFSRSYPNPMWPCRC
jgi:ABC-type transport system substrate-binding protein